MTDQEAVNEAVAGRDTLIHLAAHAHTADLLETLIKPNILGMVRLIEAAVAAGIDRIVMASSIQVTSGSSQWPRSTAVRAPLNTYALTKLWGEDYAALIARLHPRVSVLTARVGWFVRNAQEAAMMFDKAHLQDSYVSHADVADFFCRAVSSNLANLPGGFAVVYATGLSKTRETAMYDLTAGQQYIGYTPKDRFPEGLDPSWVVNNAAG